MITIASVEQTKIKPNDSFILVEIRGLSTDIKPTTYAEKKIENGSIFIEIDTGKIYFYNLENETWNEV